MKITRRFRVGLEKHETITVRRRRFSHKDEAIVVNDVRAVDTPTGRCLPSGKSNEKKDQSTEP